jgi:predicted nucleotidyltransferase
MSASDIIIWKNGHGPEKPGASRADKDPVIVWSTRDPLGGLTPAVFEAELRRLLAGRVEEAWIFGSYGTPGFSPDSDIDVFLVQKTGKAFLERALDFCDVLDLVPAMDLLVYTPEEFASLTGDPSPGFWRSAVASMRRVL